MKPLRHLGLALALGLASAAAAAASSVLFIGNSFTYGLGSAVLFWRGETVTDLNQGGYGGLPALYKSFIQQAGINQDVYLITRGGAGLEYHLENRMAVINSQPWDLVVMQGLSMLDDKRPGDPSLLVSTTRKMAEALRKKNPAVKIHLLATWPRADQTYPPGRPWSGKPISAMAQDVRAGYDKAAAGVPGIVGVIPVGEAWTRAMKTGVADPNPYDGIEAGKVSLWSWDGFHASAYGTYLEALVVFGQLTGRDPRSLGENECSGYELGFSRPQVKALQQVAFEQLDEVKAVTPAPLVLAKPVNPDRCPPPVRR